MKRTTTFTATALIIGSSLVGFGSDAAHAAPMTFVVDTLSDSPGDGYTLREALADADANAGPDTIEFAEGLAGTLTLSGGSLSSNDSVTIDGPAVGGITIDANGNSRILNSLFPGSDLTVRNLTLTGGNAPFQGGAIAVYQGNDVLIESVKFVENETADDGGALSIGAITGSIDILDSLFTENTAALDGGALHIFDHNDDGRVTIKRTNFTQNTSTGGSGGALHVDASGAVADFRDVVIDGNEAVTGDDGGANLTARYVVMTDVAITNNVAGDDRGGASVRSTVSTMNLRRLEIAGNAATSEVGGASIRSAGGINLSGSVVRSNIAASTAGLRLQSDGGVNVRRSTIESNEATAVVGGLAVLDSQRLAIEESTIQDNTAPEIGGLYLGNVEETDVEYSTIARNSATAGDGGGVFATGAVTDRLTISNSTVSGNSATAEGGGVLNDGVELVVSRSTVVENVAGLGGGGLLQRGFFVSTIFRSIVASNSAPAFESVNGPVTVDWSLLGDTTGSVFVGFGNNLASVDPMLGPLVDNGGPTATHLPTSSSVVVDAGGLLLMDDLISRDQRGARRVTGEAHDIGAVERASDDSSIWTSVQPARIVDTRVDGVTVDGIDQAEGALPAASQTTIDVAGRAGVPDDAIGVVANVTAVRPADKGFLTAHPCADQLPLAASLNYQAGVNLGNEIIIGLDDAGALCLFTSAQTHLTIDVVGYIGARSAYVPTEPARFLETRAGGSTVDGESQAIGRVEAGETVEVLVSGRGAIDSEAQAATMYVTAIRPDKVGFLTIWNCDGEMPLASSLNYAAGVNRGNEVVMNADLDESQICIFTSSAVDLTVDVVGFVPNVPNNHTSLETPVRLLDSRAGASTIDGLFAGEGMQAAGSTLELQIGGRVGVLESVRTVTMNLTAVRPGANGYVTAFPCGGEPPLASSLNHVGGVNGGNEIVASLDDQGRVCLFTFVNTHLTADVTGFTMA